MLIHIPDAAYQDTETLRKELRKYRLSLTPEEARNIRDRIGRAPTLAELFVFDIEWSEHCSYKSSKHRSKYLPVSGKYVIQIGGRCGIVEFTTHNGNGMVSSLPKATTILRRCSLKVQRPVLRNRVWIAWERQ